MSILIANVATSTANAYVSSGNTCVTWLSLTNYSAGNVTANIYVVPSGIAVGNALNTIVSNVSITVSDTYQIYAGNEKLILSDGDSIRMNASANNAIAVTVSYTSV